MSVDQARLESLRAAVERDADALREIAAELWDVLRDPLGDVLLVPRPDAVRDGLVGDEPIPRDAMDWAPVIARFRSVRGRAPVQGARALARRGLAGPRGGSARR